MRRSIIGLLIIITFFTTSGLGCRVQSEEVRQAMQPVELVWWRVFDDSDSVAPIIENYRKLHPNITITYRKLRPEEYESELINALAEDRGPDIFTIHNTATKEYQTKLLPMPRDIKMAYQVTRGTIKKEVVTELRTEKAMRPDQLKNLFIDQVADDAILPLQGDDGSVTDKIYGLPLASDNLVLYWNRDLLNAARIPEPAKTWTEFINHVKILTRLDTSGNIVQAGAALGTASNVDRASDILSIIMMQNGTAMTQNGAITFNQIPPGEEREAPPGLEALRFYTDFADPTKEAYTWNSNMPNSLESFISGTTAYFFGYSYQAPVIKARAPKLNFSIATLPQINPDNPTNFANYWIEGVSSKTTHPNEAWDFVQFATREQNVTSYLGATEKPTALRSLINTQLEDPKISVFASQALSSKSWYHGKDSKAAESALEEMIDSVVAGSLIEEAINLAASKVTQTLN